MRLLATISAMLVGLRAIAAPGDIVGAQVETNGWVLNLWVSGMGTNGTYTHGLGASNTLTGTEKLRVTFTTQGYTDACALTTNQMTVVGTKRLRLPYPGDAFADEQISDGNLRVRIALSQPIYAGDSNVTAVLSAGLYAQGGTNSAAATVSVTNSSAATYPSKAAFANWSWPGFSTVGSTITPRVVAFETYGQSNRPVRAVMFTATDGLVTVTNIQTETQIDASISNALPVQEFVGSLSTATLAAKSNITIRARAFPWRGDATCVVDSGSGEFSQPTGNFGPQYVVNDKDGTFGQAFAVVDTAASDASGYVTNSFNSGSPPTAFRTISGAAKAIAIFNGQYGSRSNCANSVIYLQSGSHAWTGTNLTVLNSPVAQTWLTITPFPGVARSNAVIASQSGSYQIGGVSGDGVKVKLSNVAVTVNALSFYNFHYIWLDECEINSPYSGLFNRMYWSVTRSEVTELGQGFNATAGYGSASVLVRGNYIRKLGAGGMVYTVLGNHIEDSASLGAWSWFGTSHTAPPAGPIFAFNAMYKWGNYSLSPLRFGRTTNDTRFAIIGNLVEVRTNAVSGVGEIGSFSIPTKGVLIWNNTLVGQRVLLAYNDTGTNRVLHEQWSVKGNIFDDANIKMDTFGTPNANRTGGWEQLWGVNWSDNWAMETGSIAPAPFYNEFVGINSYFFLDPTPSDTLKFINRMAADGTNGFAGGGDYRLQTNSPLWLHGARVQPLKWDLAGELRGTNGPPGAYGAGGEAQGGGDEGATGTYFIDFISGSDANDGLTTNTAWKLCPGMSGFAGSYAAAAGDTFNFRGGTTWTNPITVANSGSAGFENYHTYRTHPTWHSGDSWSRAVINPGGSGTAFYSLSKSYIRLNGLTITNCGATDRGVTFSQGSGWIVTNCVIASGAANGVEMGSTVPLASSNWWVQASTFQHQPNQIYMLSGTNTVTTDVRIEDNDILGNDVDPSPLHPDGIQFGGYGPDSAVPHFRSLYSFTNVVIARNRMRGSWGYGGTAQTFFGEGVTDAVIANNQFAFDNVTQYATNYLFSPGLLFLYRSDRITVANNTFSSDARNGLNQGARDGISIGAGVTNLWIWNNVFSQMEYCFNGSAMTSTNGLRMDANLYWPRSGGYSVWIPGSRSTNITTIRSWGYETNGAYGNPQFLVVPSAGVSGDYRIATNSPAASVGLDLGSEYAVDLAGGTRSGTWSMGAWEPVNFQGGRRINVNRLNIGRIIMP